MRVLVLLACWLLAQGAVRAEVWTLDQWLAHGDSLRAMGQDAAALEAAGVRTTPIRIDSQCKYAMVASGRADLYLRLAREGYREKSWDHAAGCAVVRAAGGLVESATGGEPLRIDGRWVDAPGGIVVRTPTVTVPAM